MPAALTDEEQFEAVQAPADGDPAAGATFEVGYQDLADRTRFLLKNSDLSIAQLRVTSLQNYDRFNDVCFAYGAGPFDAGLWLVVGHGNGSSSSYMLSYDGESWAPYTYADGDSGIIRGVCHGGAGAVGSRMFVMVGQYTDTIPYARIWTAPDDAAAGSTYIPQLAISIDSTGVGAHAGAFRSVAWNGTVFCAVGDLGIIYTATDPTGTWTSRTAGSSYAGNFTKVIASGTTLIACGSGGEIQRSTNNGATWTRVRTGTGGALSSIVATYNAIVVGTAALDFILRSTDSGATWAEIDVVDSPPFTLGEKLVYRLGRMTACLVRHETDPMAFTALSIDGGLTWPYAVRGPSCFGYHMHAAASGDRVVLVGGHADGTTSAVAMSSGCIPDTI